VGITTLPAVQRSDLLGWPQIADCGADRSDPPALQHKKCRRGHHRSGRWETEPVASGGVSQITDSAPHRRRDSSSRNLLWTTAGRSAIHSRYALESRSLCSGETSIGPSGVTSW